MLGGGPTTTCWGPKLLYSSLTSDFPLSSVQKVKTMQLLKVGLITCL